MDCVQLLSVVAETWRLRFGAEAAAFRVVGDIAAAVEVFGTHRDQAWVLTENEAWRG